MIQIFLKGGLVMWPLLAVSLVALTVVLERLWFTLREKARRDRAVVAEIFAAAERGDLGAAQEAGADSQDYVARVLTYALEHRDVSFANALLQAAGLELQRFNRGISTLDTIVTLAPLLGLFGTVTGMIHAFDLLGASKLGAPTEITGGIAEALIATAFGLLIAMVSLLPFNYLNSQLENARQDLQNSAAHLELLLLKSAKQAEPAPRA
ncbi:MAG: MotA/TolQ/ExbB proton channel family protein [Chthoniobacter sp.]|nr:MotA/TolQ/ExbB proton channel family protein [Chthoniobacter sp.]